MYFHVQYKLKNQKHWSVLSYNEKPGGNFVVLDLNPATWYNLLITAHNNAGLSVAEYEFPTLTATGGKVRRAIKTKESKNSLDFFLTLPPS